MNDNIYSKSELGVGGKVSLDSIMSEDSLGTGSGSEEDGGLSLFDSLTVVVESGSSGSGSDSLSFIGSGIGCDVGGVFSDGSGLGTGSGGLSSFSGFVAVGGSVVGRFGSSGIGRSIGKDTGGSGSFSGGSLRSILRSGAVLSGSSFGNLGEVPFSESLLLDGKGGGGGFGGNEVSVGGSDLSSKGGSLGSGHLVVMSDGLFVGSDGGQPFGVPFSLESDLLGSGVFSREVELGSNGSLLNKLKVSSNELGTSSLGFLERVFVEEERLIGEIGSLLSQGGHC